MLVLRTAAHPRWSSAGAAEGATQTFEASSRGLSNAPTTSGGPAQQRYHIANNLPADAGGRSWTGGVGDQQEKWGVFTSRHLQ